MSRHCGLSNPVVDCIVAIDVNARIDLVAPVWAELCLHRNTARHANAFAKFYKVVVYREKILKDLHVLLRVGRPEFETTAVFGVQQDRTNAASVFVSGFQKREPKMRVRR